MLQGVKEDYLIAKQNKANPYVLLRFVEVSLAMMNPIIPHFAQYCWKKYAFPAIKQSANFEGKLDENLIKMGWPKPSAQFDKAAAEKFSFMKDVKSIIRLGLDQSKGGGKKAKKGAPVEAKTLENAVVFVAIEYPEFKKKCLEIL